MFNSPVFETIIALVVVLLIFAVLVSCFQEGIATLTRSRGKMLESAINEVLHDKFNKNFAYLLYQHPQIDLLKRKQDELPSYIDGETFASALVDMIAKESTETVYRETNDKTVMEKKEQFTQPVLEKMQRSKNQDLEAASTPDTDPANVPVIHRFRMGAQSLQYSDLKKLLLSFDPATAGMRIEQGIDELEVLKARIKKWYDGYMDRVTGWYKRKIRKNIFFAATVVTLFFNLNFITLTKNLYADSKLRGTLNTMADSMANDSTTLSSIKQKLVKDSATFLGDVNINALVGAELPIGWKLHVNDAGTEGKNWFVSKWIMVKYFFKNHVTWQNLAGWFIFMLCLTLGAPFWFDILKKLVNIRNAGKTPTTQS
ncbi:MAG: hypothetical protein NTW29_12245 [Bacteroidetes bacterium]|nr:hypothetical protein [Bacteroidota bacterium]